MTNPNKSNEQAMREAVHKLINSEELAAFERFCEICDDMDADGYDVPLIMMKRLAEIGVVRRVTRDIYTVTDFGNFIESTKELSLIEPLSAAPCVCGEPQAPNTVHRTDGPCYQSAATAGQESEAQAVGEIVFFGDEECKEVSWNRGKIPPIGAKLYLAPPSAIAIETAAKLQAAEVCESVYPEDCKLYLVAKGFGEKVRATIPQDGITELEKFGMKVGREAFKAGEEWERNHHPMTSPNPGDIVSAIVKSLIGEK